MSIYNNVHVDDIVYVHVQYMCTAVSVLTSWWEMPRHLSSLGVPEIRIIPMNQVQTSSNTRACINHNTYMYTAITITCT